MDNRKSDIGTLKDSYVPQMRRSFSAQLEQFRESMGISSWKQCTADEHALYNNLLQNGKPLPEDVYMQKSGDGKYTFYRDIGAKTEIIEYLMHNQISVLMKINKCVAISAVLAIISAAVSLLSVFGILRILN